jgi:hypothetical protein
MSTPPLAAPAVPPAASRRIACDIVSCLALALLACSNGDDSPRAPLRQPGATPGTGRTASAPLPAAPHATPPATPLTADARAALQRGNAAMRARRYPEALAAYRAAALIAPHNAAPQFGIQMVARAIGDSALADSAARRLRALTPALPTRAGGTAGPHALPPGHPTVP